MPERVRMKVRQTVLLFNLSQLPVNAVRVHWLPVLLSKHISMIFPISGKALCFGVLPFFIFLKHIDNGVRYRYPAHTFFGRWILLECPPFGYVNAVVNDMDTLIIKIDILPLDTKSFTSATAGVD